METFTSPHTIHPPQGTGTDSLDLFDYSKAFARNLGLVQPDEQHRLQQSVVAIAGLGGVGGVHLTTLARLGIGGFHIADFDSFEIQNFNLTLLRENWSKVNCVGGTEGGDND